MSSTVRPNNKSPITVMTNINDALTDLELYGPEHLTWILAVDKLRRSTEDLLVLMRSYNIDVDAWCVDRGWPYDYNTYKEWSDTDSWPEEY